MRTLFALIAALMCYGASVQASDDVFMPSADCFPDPVLDSITVEHGRLYVEDHFATSGEVSYIMHKVNHDLYEIRRDAQRLYLISVGTGFAGVAATVTGNIWLKNYSGTRRDVGLGMMIWGVPLTAASVATFTVGVVKANKTERKFMRECLGLKRISQVDVGVGTNSLRLVAHLR